MFTFFGAALGVEYARPKVGPPRPAGGASERAESRCDAPDVDYGLRERPPARLGMFSDLK